MKIAILNTSESISESIIQLLAGHAYHDVQNFTKFKEFQSALTEVKFDLVITEYLLDQGRTAKDVLEAPGIGQDTHCIVRTSFYDRAIYDALKLIRPIVFLPISESSLDLIQSIEYLKNTDLKISASQRKISSTFFIKIGDRHRQIRLEDVYYFEVDGKYLNVVCEGKKFIMRSTLSELQQKVEGRFIRVHSAFLVNLDKIVSFKLSENLIDLNGFTIPLSRRYKPDLLDAIIVP